MDSTFLGLLDNHVKAVREAGDAKTANEVLLKTIKLLIDNVDSSDGTLSGYDEMEMRKLFSSFGNVAQTACEFFQGAKNHLDPAAMKGKIGQKLESASREIAEVNSSIETLEQNSAELLEKENELDNLSDIYIKKEARVLELKKIKDTVTPEKLEQLEREAGELDEFIRMNQKIKDGLDGKISEYKTMQKSLSDAIVLADSEINEIRENVIETIDTKVETMREICTAQNRDLEQYKIEIEGYQKQYAQFADDLAELKVLHENYKLHLGENSEIQNELKKAGILSMDKLADEIENLKKAVKGELERYDSILGNVIKAQENLKEALISKSKPQAS